MAHFEQQQRGGVVIHGTSLGSEDGKRLPDANGQVIFDYESPRFGYRAALRFARDGVVVDYPHIGTRVSG